jgi:hypothetical protein
MTESLPNESRSKKMANRNVVVALALVCIVLVALATYSAVTAINTISQLKAKITSLQNQITSLETSLISTVKIASVTKQEGWSSQEHLFTFTIQVKNIGTDTVNGITVEIRLYHDWMNVRNGSNGPTYTNEIQNYGSNKGNIFDFGIIPAGRNATQTQTIGVGDGTEGGGIVPVNYAVATLAVANITIDKQTLQFNNQTQQIWIFP